MGESGGGGGREQTLAIDFVKEPPFFEVSPTHKAKTWYLDPRCPAFERPENIRNYKEKIRQRG